MRLISIGYGNLISAERIIAMVRPESSPVTRLITDAKASNMLIDASRGRKTKAVIVMDSGHIVLSANQPSTIGNRVGGEADLGIVGDEEE